MPDPVVPYELDALTRRLFRRHRCDLCTVTIAGSRAVASTIDTDALTSGGDPAAPTRPLWVVHHACYLRAFRAALSYGLAHLPTEDAAHEALRAGITERVQQQRLRARLGMAAN